MLSVMHRGMWFTSDDLFSERGRKESRGQPSGIS